MDFNELCVGHAVLLDNRSRGEPLIVIAREYAVVEMVLHHARDHFDITPKVSGIWQESPTVLETEHSATQPTCFPSPQSNPSQSELLEPLLSLASDLAINLGSPSASLDTPKAPTL